MAEVEEEVVVQGKGGQSNNNVEGISGVKTFQINLDLSPDERWLEVAEEYKEELKGVETIVDNFIAENTNRIAAIGVGFASSIFSFITKCGVVYYNEELKSIADVSGIPLGKIAMLQLVYESAARCTSIVAKGENGLPLHFRTMDWEMDFLRPLTVNYEFYRKGKLIFKGPSWVGYVGMFTGVKPNAFSVSVNFRVSEGTFWQNFKKAVARSWPIGFLVREVLDTCSIYESAVSSLSESALIAPTYFTIAGVKENQATVVTRERGSVVNPICLSERPFLVQANMDHFSDDPYDDIMDSVGRRRLAANLLAQAEQFSVEDAWKIMSRRPIWNDITCYGCVMSASTGVLETRLPNPDTGFLPSANPLKVTVQSLLPQK